MAIRRLNLMKIGPESFVLLESPPPPPRPRNRNLYWILIRCCFHAVLVGPWHLWRQHPWPNLGVEDKNILLVPLSNVHKKVFFHHTKEAVSGQTTIFGQVVPWFFAFCRWSSLFIEFVSGRSTTGRMKRTCTTPRVLFSLRHCSCSFFLAFYLYCWWCEGE